MMHCALKTMRMRSCSCVVKQMTKGVTNFLDQKCKDLNIPFALGRAGATAAVLQPGNPGSPRIARVPGRAVLDGIDQLKAGFWAFDSFSLDNVAHELLGVGKLISTDSDKVAEINRRFRDNKPELADYNLRDCTLVNDIFIKADLIAFAVQRANLTGLALDRLGGSVAAFDNLYLPKLHREGFVAPDVSARDDGGSPGGFVMDSIPGLYRDVLVLDFKTGVCRSKFFATPAYSPGFDRGALACTRCSQTHKQCAVVTSHQDHHEFLLWCLGYDRLPIP